jgi:hypothetical protein
LGVDVVAIIEGGIDEGSGGVFIVCKSEMLGSQGRSAECSRMVF